MSRKTIAPSELPSEPVEIRLHHAKNGTDPEELTVLSKDSFWFVRNYVAANICTPEDCLKELLKDPDFRVRKEAERTLHKQSVQRQFDPAEWQKAMSKLPLNERLMAAAARTSGMSAPIDWDRSRD